MFNRRRNREGLQLEMLGDIPVLHFASGSNHPGEIQGFVDLGKAVGAAFAGTTTNKRTGRTTWSRNCGPECVRALIEAGRAGLPVFLDSGAFSEVKFKPRRVVAEITDPMWKERFEVYRQLADALGPLANVVAPDKVGFQEESFERLERFAPELRELIESGATLLVPLQKGNLTLAEAHAMAASILGTEQWVPAIPFKKATATPEDLEEYLSLVRPPRVHLLGVGPRSSIAPQIAQAVRRGSPRTQVQMDSVVLTAHTARKGGIRRITAAQDAARERLREERHSGYKEVVSPDWTDLVGSPSHWASPTALRRIGKAHGVKGADLKELLAHPDDFFQKQMNGWPFYAMAEPEIHAELAKRMHKEETFETKRGGVREGIGELYGGPAFIRNTEQRWEGHVPGVDTLGPPGSQLGLSFGSAYQAPIPSADQNPETAAPGRLTIFNMGLGRDSMTMLCLLAQGELGGRGPKARARGRGRGGVFRHRKRMGPHLRPPPGGGKVHQGTRDPVLESQEAPARNRNRAADGRLARSHEEGANGTGGRVERDLPDRRPASVPGARAGAR